MRGSLKAISFGEKLANEQFRPSGFDYIRILLAMSVVVTHAATIAQGEQAGVEFFNGPLSPYFKSILPAFFALSGFLVSGSMERSKTLVNFLGLRVIRIYPALVVEVVLSALLIGPLVTVVPLHTYFTSPQFFRYLVNVTGHISYYLPGVFTHNPKPDIVNWQLWTVPWELVCYVSISALILLGLKSRRYIILIAILGLTLAVNAKTLLSNHGAFEPLSGHVWGPDLVLYFLTGVAIYMYKDRIPWSWPLCLALGGFGMFALSVLPGGQYLAMFPLVYTTVFLGLCNPKRLIFIGIADYSYGLYLYGYVIQQFVTCVFPWSRTWYLNLLIALPAGLLAGMASWYGVERPALKLRGTLKTIEARWIELKSGALPWSQRARAQES